jgi:hypothetical protein
MTLSPESPGALLLRLVTQWRHNAQGCGRLDRQCAATWRSCARELESAISSSLEGQAEDADTRRIDWIERQVQQYGDGYTEPCEAGWHIQWQQQQQQQQRPNETWPGLRRWIDEEMAHG